MSEEIADKFWEKWTKADELEKIHLVETLAVIKGNKAIKTGFQYSVASLVNSYLVDLMEYLNGESKKGKSGREPIDLSSQNMTFQHWND